MGKHTECSVEGCSRAGSRKDLCTVHYWRLRKRGDVGVAALERERHGRYGTPEYICWSGLINRCTNPNNRSFMNYGARGITVCDRWRHSFLNFLEDMGEKPPGLTLDRIDNDGNYEPGNCRWASRTTQTLNQRMKKNNKSGYKGVSYSKREKTWVARIMVNYRSIYLGNFDSPQKAAIAYQSAERKYHSV